MGRPQNGDVLRLEGFLRRNGHPYQRQNPETDIEAKALIERFQSSRVLLLRNANSDYADSAQNAAAIRGAGRRAPSDRPRGWSSHNTPFTLLQ